MKFSAKTDIEAPIAFVYAALANFDAWERNAMRRGVDIVRTDKLSRAGLGSSWHVIFQFRGRKRELDLKVMDLSGPNRMEVAANSPVIDASLVFDLLEMSSKRTRLHITANVTPLTLTSKLFIQSLRLARARVERRFKLRVDALGNDIKQRYDEEQRTV
jgi:hypothetical protein